MILTAIIEIPQGSLLKYEIDKSDDSICIDRCLNQPVPYNYGFFPGTLCEDGDCLDLFCLGNVAIYPLSKVKINILGVLKCLDNGQRDDKIIAFVNGDQTGSKFMGIDVIRTYLTSYKKGFEILSFEGYKEAVKVYEDSVELYNKNVIG